MSPKAMQMGSVLALPALVAVYMVAFALALPGLEIATGHPIWVMAVLALLLVIVTVQELREVLSEGPPPQGDAVPRPWWAANRPTVTMITLLGGYALALGHLGFYLSSAIFTAVAIYVLGYRRLPIIALIAGVTVLALWALFGELLGLRLPSGPFGG